MLELRIDCSPKDTQDDIAQIIHESLVGYEEYINNNILLNKDGEYITLLIGPESEKNKKLKLVCYAERVGETTHYCDAKMVESQESEE